MALVRLQAVNRHDHALLAREPTRQAFGFGQADGGQLVVALQQVAHSAPAEGQAQLAAEMLVDFGLRAVAQGADQGDGFQSGLGLGQGEAALGLGAVRPVKLEAGGVDAAADLQAQANQALQSEHGSAVIVGPPHWAGAVGAFFAQGLQLGFRLGPGTGGRRDIEKTNLIQTQPHGEVKTRLIATITPHPL